uniref:Uncharacterized protein n=1 Tax=Timema bartmani TaxID=61472 RepID=A0A7R9I494_9NEOP|nr:unnamed protein product [Timema bartmani]
MTGGIEGEAPNEQNERGKEWCVQMGNKEEVQCRVSSEPVSKRTAWAKTDRNNTIMSNNKENILLNPQNKSRMIQLVNKYLESRGCQALNAKCDADVLIVEEGVKSSVVMDAVVTAEDGEIKVRISLSSPMASLVLTDSSQLTADGFEKLPDQIICELSVNTKEAMGLLYVCLKVFGSDWKYFNNVLLFSSLRIKPVGTIFPSERAKVPSAANLQLLCGVRASLAK